MFCVAWWPHVHYESIAVIEPKKFVKEDKGYNNKRPNSQRCTIIGTQGEIIKKNGDIFTIKKGEYVYSAYKIDHTLWEKGEKKVFFREHSQGQVIIDNITGSKLIVECAQYIIDVNVSDIIDKKKPYFIKIVLDILTENISIYKNEFLMASCELDKCLSSGLAQYDIIVDEIQLNTFLGDQLKEQLKEKLTDAIEKQLIEELKSQLINTIYHQAKSFYHIHECREHDSHIKLFISDDVQEIEKANNGTFAYKAAAIHYIKQITERLHKTAYRVSDYHRKVANITEINKPINASHLIVMKKTRQLCNDAIVENSYVSALLFSLNNTQEIEIFEQNMNQSIDYIKHINTVFGDILGEQQFGKSILISYRSLWLGGISIAVGFAAATTLILWYLEKEKANPIGNWCILVGLVLLIAEKYHWRLWMKKTVTKWWNNISSSVWWKDIFKKSSIWWKDAFKKKG